jgi:hypothetical protein
VELGQFLKFTGCYLTSVSLSIANSFNLEGYPHSVSARVSLDVMDVSFVGYNGSFMEDGFGNQAVQMGKIMGAFRDVGAKATESVGKQLGKIFKFAGSLLPG